MSTGYKCGICGEEYWDAAKHQSESHPAPVEAEKELERIVAKYITRETHKGSVNRVRYLMAEELKQAIYSLLASEAVAGIKPDGSIMQAVPLGVIKELLGVAE